MGEDTEYEQWQNEGKAAINGLLWEKLPSSTTIGKAEEIAVAIYHLINAEWNRHIMENMNES